MMATFKQNSGHYSAAYSFTNEAVGETEPTGWTNDDGAGTESRILLEHRGHLKFLDSNDNSGANNARLYRTFAASHDSGIVEFWATVELINFWTYYRFATSAPLTICGVYLLATATGFNIKNMAGTTLNTSIYELGEWVHIAICFNNSGGALDCGDGENLDDGKYRVYLNTTKINDYALTNAADAEIFEIVTATTAP